ncbi:MAG: HAD-IIB family hydrolase [Hungatella sp.]|nr:HAD-IIB family hydrolase [Hungatella sp.]
MYRYIVSDLDGTLIKDDGTVDEKSLRLIDKYLKNQIIDKFIIATGRHFRELKDILELFTYSHNIISICCDGQYIYDFQGNLMNAFDAFVKPGDIPIIMNENNIRRVFIITDKKVYQIIASPIKRVLLQIKRRVKSNQSASSIINVSQCEQLRQIEKLMIYPKKEKKINLKELGKKYYVHFLKSGIIEILCTNKFTALEYLDREAVINLKDTLYFGDDDNDVECFQGMVNCIAMKNASETIKLAAKYVTGTNNEHGVYMALKDRIGANE